MIIRFLRKIWFLLFPWMVTNREKSDSLKIEDKEILKSKVIYRRPGAGHNQFAPILLNPEYHPRRKKLKGWQKENHKFK